MRRLFPFLLACALTFAVAAPAHAQTTPSAPSSTGAAPGLLTREQAGALMPSSVFYRGQTATTQARNSGGVRGADGKLTLFALVDVSGYSSAVQQTYQAYAITEVPLRIGTATLPPGAYGFGFLADGTAAFMDLGGNRLFSSPTTHDPALRRPTPLQVLNDEGHSGSYRLYLGRTFVSFQPAQP